MTSSACSSGRQACLAQVLMTRSSEAVEGFKSFQAPMVMPSLYAIRSCNTLAPVHPWQRQTHSLSDECPLLASVCLDASSTVIRRNHAKGELSPCSAAG